LKADTGATAHYIKANDAGLLHALTTTKTGPSVRLPNNTTMQTQLRGHLPISNIPKQATQAHVFKDLQSASLLSVGQLCDSDCTAVFTKTDLQIFDTNKQVIIRGTRNFQDGLWDVHLQQPSPSRVEHTVNAILKIDKRSQSDLAQYLHACAYSPTKSTFLTAIRNGHFITWPGLTYDLINKHLTTTIATSKGHLKQEQRNIRTTQIEIPNDDNILDHHPTQDIEQAKTHECYITYYAKEEGITYSDLTGIYSTKSSRGNQYIVVCYDYDTNSIQARLTKTRNAAEIRNATMLMIEKLSISYTVKSAKECMA
jgi:hypothetical protein